MRGKSLLIVAVLGFVVAFEMDRLFGDGSIAGHLAAFAVFAGVPVAVAALPRRYAVFTALAAVIGGFVLTYSVAQTTDLAALGAMFFAAATIVYGAILAVILLVRSNREKSNTK